MSMLKCFPEKLDSAKYFAKICAEKIQKHCKYANLFQQLLFGPVAFEIGGASGLSTKRFVKNLGTRVAQVTGDKRETAWLWQRFSMNIVLGNAVSNHRHCQGSG